MTRRRRCGPPPKRLDHSVHTWVECMSIVALWLAWALDNRGRPGFAAHWSKFKKDLVKMDEFAEYASGRRRA